MEPHQIRMARAALQWGVRDLAEKAETTPGTVSRIENGGEALSGTLERIAAALAAAGATLIPDDGYGAGVRFKPAAKAPRPSRRRK